MKKKLLSIFFAILVFAIPVLSIVNGQPLTDVLRDNHSASWLTLQYGNSMGEAREKRE